MCVDSVFPVRLPSQRRRCSRRILCDERMTVRGMAAYGRRMGGLENRLRVPSAWPVWAGTSSLPSFISSSAKHSATTSVLQPGLSQAQELHLHISLWPKLDVILSSYWFAIN